MLSIKGRPGHCLGYIASIGQGDPGVSRWIPIAPSTIGNVLPLHCDFISISAFPSTGRELNALDLARPAREGRWLVVDNIGIPAVRGASNPICPIGGEAKLHGLALGRNIATLAKVLWKGNVLVEMNHAVVEGGCVACGAR